MSDEWDELRRILNGVALSALAEYEGPGRMSPTETIDALGPTIMEWADALVEERDQLRAAAQDVCAWLDHEESYLIEAGYADEATDHADHARALRAALGDLEPQEPNA